ncbi:MAG: T9SS type A sorting domain-containing protein [Bacteroidales bacterium]|nr:T9SS type A sorting domain-containing protein [Bacteroidales bacterium]
MKKFTLLLLLVSFTTYSFSQLITISGTHQFPVDGDTVHYKDANTFGFDAAGTGTVTDKTWDFAALMDAGTNFYYFWEDASSTPEFSSFPSSTIARGNSGEAGYFYYEFDATDQKRWGWYGTATNYGIYNSPGTEFHFPITAGNNFSSSYSGIMSPFGVGEDSVTISDGSISIQADMQGTLILPNGTLTNVLRVHVVESFHIKAWMMEMAVMDNVVEDDYYYWFHDTVAYPVMIYGVTSLDGTEQSEVLRYQPLVFSTPVLSDATDFLTYSFSQQTGPADINTTIHSIDIEVANGTSLNALIAEFTLSEGANADISGVAQVSTVTANNFIVPVTYTVTAEDGTTEQDWLVTVTEEASGINNIVGSNNMFFPNPSTGLVSFAGRADRIIITDIIGNIVKDIVNPNNLTIDFSDNSQGIYFVKTIKGLETKTCKLVIKK